MFTKTIITRTTIVGWPPCVWMCEVVINVGQKPNCTFSCLANCQYWFHFLSRAQVHLILFQNHKAHGLWDYSTLAKRAIVNGILVKSLLVVAHAIVVPGAWVEILWGSPCQ